MAGRPAGESLGGAPMILHGTPFFMSRTVQQTDPIWASDEHLMREHLMIPLT